MADSIIHASNDPFYLDAQLDTSVPVTLTKHWSELPQNKPFYGNFVCSGQNFIWGFVYSGGAYGKVFISDIGTGRILVVRRFEGNFSIYTINAELLS